MASISLRTRAPEIIAGVRISDVYQALTGVKPRRTGSDRWRAPAIWRDGEGLNVSMDDSRGVWHDFKTDDGDGVLALVVQVRGGSRQNALHWLADLTGTPLCDRPFPPAESAKLARERWEYERDLPAARHWRRAAIAMSEELLVVLKTAFSDPTAESDVTGAELRDVTQQLACLKRLDGVELVAEYRWWEQHDPQLTAGMVGAAETLETAERRALLAYLRMMALGASV